MAEHGARGMADLMERAVSMGGHFRAVAAITTGVLEDLRRRQELSPGACVALGRALTGAFLLASELKGDQKVMVQVLGKGPLGEIVAEAYPTGQGRGYVRNPRAEVPASSGKIHLSQALSPPGTLTVIKDLGLKEPYRGVVPLVSGEIGKDLAHYLWVSEQIPSAVAVGVYVEPNLSIGAAGGYLVQTMPGATNDEIDLVERNVRELPPPTELIRRGDTPRRIVQEVLLGHDLKWLGSQPLRFGCRCSRARVSQALVAMGVEELEEMIRGQDSAEVTCEFCSRLYVFSAHDLRRLLGKALARQTPKPGQALSEALIHKGGGTMSTPRHCPGFESFKNLKAFACRCPNCGAEKEIFSDEFDKRHVCPSCRQEIDFTRCELEVSGETKTVR